MRLVTAIILAAATLIAAPVEAAKMIAIAGRVVDASGQAIPAANVVLAIGTKDHDKLVQDTTDVDGVFQLVRYPVGDFTELWVWIDRPYESHPVKVSGSSGDVFNSKLQQISVGRIKTGPISKSEAADRLSTVFEIERRKQNLGIVDAAASQRSSQRRIKEILARCEGAGEVATLKGVCEDAKNHLKPDDRGKSWQDTQNFVLGLPSDKGFQALVAVESQKFQEGTQFVADYMQGKVTFDPEQFRYASGLDPKRLKPNLFGTDLASKSIVNQFVPAGANPQQGTVLLYDAAAAYDQYDTAYFNQSGFSFPLTGLAISQDQPPSKDAISTWVQSNPNGSKLVLKARALSDSALGKEDINEVNREFYGLNTLVLPAEK
jgi:hypothetical protein